jgi:tetratricopeptide (TPR) repeat protein
MYKEIINTYPQSPYANKAQINIRSGQILSLIDDGHDQKAFNEVNSLISDFNNNDHIPAAVSRIAENYYRKAFEFKSQGNCEQADRCFQKTIELCRMVINDIPHADGTALAYDYAGGSCRRLGQYQESINYLQRLVDQFPKYSTAGNALFLIGQNYQDMKENGIIAQQDADSKTITAYRRLVEKYPSSKASDAARDWLTHNQ